MEIQVNSYFNTMFVLYEISDILINRTRIFVLIDIVFLDNR